jgi:asparagine synthase (glutamine-hydrolysing)
MCGIAGFLAGEAHQQSGIEVDARLREMARRLHHRGPDGSGIWADACAGLAHTRLAVIDTSNAGAQPMHDDQGHVHIVFNGEIYNFQVLRAELVSRGYRFASHSDTEVLIYGFKEWGTGLFRRLTGMFALAIWDSRSRRMVLARDRFGEKPLYYTQSAGLFAFASEIKALFALPEVARRPDREALHDYLTFGYTLGPATAFVGIQRLPAAHYMQLEPGRPPVLTRYWELPAPAEQVPGDLNELRHGIVERLKAAVKGCMISDVPLGAFLSGGVDSSAVVAMMRDQHQGTIETFSSGFDRENYDETRYARMVSERYQTNHHVFNFGTSVLASINKLAWHYGEPYSDSSALVTFALAEQVRKSVTVALTGDGADELFLGYHRYFRFRQLVQESPPTRLRALGSLYGSAPASGAQNVAVDSYGFLVERFREHHKLAAYGPAMLTTAQRCSYDRLGPLYAAGADPLETASRFDQSTYLTDNMLVKVDVATMAHSLESRSPFLNHELAEYAARIPAAQRVWADEGKALLKSALEPYLPHEAMYRTKMGFRVPVAYFMQTLAARQTAALLDCERFAARGLIRPAYVKQLLAEHVAGKYDHGTRIWTLVCLEMWFRTYIDNDGAAVLPEHENPFAEFAYGVGDASRLSGAQPAGAKPRRRAVAGAAS